MSDRHRQTDRQTDSLYHKQRRLRVATGERQIFRQTDRQTDTNAHQKKKKRKKDFQVAAMLI